MEEAAECMVLIVEWVPCETSVGVANPLCEVGAIGLKR